jgi:AbrB family looped-hinge helix DNA binding protein
MAPTLRTRVRIADGGRIVIPVQARKRLGLKVGTEVELTVDEDCATIMSAKAARRRACKRVRDYISPDASLSEELMAERKEEATRE